MPNTVGYNPMQQNQQQQQLSNYNYQEHHHRHHQHHHHHHYDSHQLSPISQTYNVSSFSNHRLNNDNNKYHTHQTPTAMLVQLPTQSSAYFLDRTDLENYTEYTLKQMVENILSKTKSKGLKVKISLPDDGLLIDNITDPNQSWIFKTSELLYFWRDPYYLNIVVIVTINRSRHHSNRHYSASIFRLRGTDSTNSFVQRAQQFFAKLSSSVSTSSISKNNKNALIEKPTRTENRVIDHNHSSNNNTTNNNKNKGKHLSTINEQFSSTTTDRHHSPKTSTPIRLVTRAEFDPGKISTESIGSLYNRRTYSETASSTDSQANSTREILSYTKKSNDNSHDDDDKMTTVSNNLSIEDVAELVRELKELRNEIAALKLEKRIIPSTRSMSTSPLAVYSEKSKHTVDSSSPSFFDVTSQSEIDAETQTDFSLINHRRWNSSKKNKKTMVGSGGISLLTKRKSQTLSSRNNRRTLSNSSTNTVSDQEELSSQVNDSSNHTNTVLIQEQYHPTVLAAPPRPVLLRNQNDFMASKNSTFYTMSTDSPMISNSNSNEEGPFLQGIPVTVEKEMSKFLSTNIPSSDIIGPTVPILTAGTGSFRSSLENSNAPTEHIYENVSILMQTTSNQEPYYNIPIINGNDQQTQQDQQQTQSDGYLYYTIVDNRGSESQQPNGVSYGIPKQTVLNSPPSTENNSPEIQSSTTIQPQKPQIISMGRHRSQPVYFANHLTNPMFNSDRQLLTNTIANQFGVDLHSPQLQQLVTNQHLFAARKRTFANMVWQLTPDEETALTSSPITAQTDIIDIDTIDSNNSTVRSILKATKRFRPVSKRRSIRWDSALE